MEAALFLCMLASDQKQMPEIKKLGIAKLWTAELNIIVKYLWKKNPEVWKLLK